MHDKHLHNNYCERTREILNRVGDKWSLLVISALAEGPKRYVDIRRSTSGISQRMLTLTLRLLERDGIVMRTPLDTIPLSVSYELTSLGLSLVETVRSLTKWARTHDTEIGDAHMRYDRTKEREKTGIKLR
ncbi:winged helix-turn-helix transcriptional regulator [Bradyrhizobium iriomotense]|uniref:Transcriptional regulator n=1 Tax=Bradyrhizobium iriomotense TaxID=441950 RepID=A0ABQ6B900_9BRAD|nr:helix-turn-helix domain-containing protein [Bradyrhizobium iriomotense]GLR88577.1 transcriptional regulator [Bradyrhizobium iriomotense]